jgi:hypothetical protein
MFQGGYRHRRLENVGRLPVSECCDSGIVSGFWPSASVQGDEVPSVELADPEVSRVVFSVV